MNRRKVDLVKPNSNTKAKLLETDDGKCNRQFPSHDRYIKRHGNAYNYKWSRYSTYQQHKAPPGSCGIIPVTIIVWPFDVKKSKRNYFDLIMCKFKPDGFKIVRILS